MADSTPSLRQDATFLRKALHSSLFPCILSILSSNLNILADGILVGQRIGTDGLSAINLCVPVYLVLCVVGSFLVSGTAIQTSKAIGRHEPETAQALYHTAVTACLVCSLVVTGIGLVLLPQITAILCSDPSLRPMVSEYTAITIIGALPKILIYVPFWYLRMDGRAKLVTWMMLIMGGGNVVLDLLFLYPLDWGVAGAAWASVISTAVACVLGFVWLCDKKSSFRPGTSLILDLPRWKQIAADGSPSALNNLFQTLRLLIVNALFLAAGGVELMAAFSAVNCINAFGMAITDGVPQAASAMLGIYSAEKDNDSTALLIRMEWRTGLWCCGLFSLIVILGADLIAAAYALPVDLHFALVCLSASMVPGLWCSILSGLYNVSGQVRWANLIIFCRVFLEATTSLWLLVQLNLSPWLFLILSEVLTLAIWLLGMAILHRRNPSRTRFLLMDRTLEQQGQVMNFSVDANTEHICQASERISDFCTENDMSPRQIMRFSLIIEEILTMIAQFNGDAAIHFDIRAFAIPDTIGVRIRYDGQAYDPFAVSDAEDDAYLGIRMISSITSSVQYQRTFGVNTIQILIS